MQVKHFTTVHSLAQKNIFVNIIQITLIPLSSMFYRYDVQYIYLSFWVTSNHCQGLFLSNSGLLHAMQIPYSLCYCSCTDLTIFLRYIFFLHPVSQRCSAKHSITSYISLIIIHRFQETYWQLDHQGVFQSSSYVNCSDLDHNYHS